MAVQDCIRGFVVGSVIGTALGILYAPKRGKEMRETICKSSKELLEQVEEQYDEAREKIEKLALHEKELYDEKKERLKKALEAGVEAYKKEKCEIPTVTI